CPELLAGRFERLEERGEVGVADAPRVLGAEARERAAGGRPALLAAELLGREEPPQEVLPSVRGARRLAEHAGRGGVPREDVGAERRSCEGGGARPTIDALLVTRPTVAHPPGMPHATLTAKLGEHDVGRIGFGAMQLAGPGVFGPPRDRDAALAVLRRAVELG